MTSDKKLTPTACYVRVSHQEQRLRGLSPDAQREALTRYAKEHDLKIVEWYEDLGVSGRKLIKNRPALQQMIKDAEAGKFERIIFIKLDRYFRSVAEYYECQKRLEAKKVLWTATEEKYNLADASGRYWVTQKLAMAEYEADLTGERIDLVNEFKVRTGQALTGAQSQGLAYTVEKDKDGAKRVVKDPETAPVVTDYINHVLTHHNKRQAFLYVNEKYNTNYSYESLRKVLLDTKIYGHYRGNDNYCEPYVDKATFDKLQEINNSKSKIRKNKHVYLFSGLIKCPVCGKRMAGSFSTGGTRKRGDKVYIYDNEYYLYRCNHHHISKNCTFHRRVNETKIERYLLTNFDELIKEYIEVDSIKDVKDSNPDVKKITTRIAEIKTEQTNLNIMFRKNRISESDYDKDYEALESELNKLETKLEPEPERDLTLYESILNSGWRNLYDVLIKENKRSFWRKYVKAIHLNEDGTVKEVIFF